jgi:ABC-type nitrate/sulfonate/bicarbonate transport system substrate-binding protein
MSERVRALKDRAQRREQAVRSLSRRTFCATVLAGAAGAAAASDRIAIAYQAVGGISWPLYIGQQGGYYNKYGFDAKPLLAPYPGGVAMLVSEQAAILLSSLQQVLPAAAKDRSLVAIGGMMNRSTFSLIASTDIPNVRGLKGKRIAVGQVGDATYGYLIAVLKDAGLSERDVDLIPAGAEPAARAAALVSGRADATLLFAPNSFHMEDAGYRNLADLAAYDNIFTTVAYWVRRASLSTRPAWAERLIQAHAEAVRRFYEDRSFAIQSYLSYNKEAAAADVARTYDQYSRLQLFERVPYVLQGAVAAALDQQAAPARNQSPVFRDAVDNSIVDRLVKRNFFLNLFGSSLKVEQDAKSRLAFR